MGKELEKLKAKIVIDSNGCWLFRPQCSGYREYGNLRINGRLQLSHRVFYELEYGPIPHGHVIHHVCGNKRCVNPKHLQAVIPKDHANRHRSEIRFCPAGHEYIPENTRIDKRGRRSCKTCHRIRMRKPHHRAYQLEYQRSEKGKQKHRERQRQYMQRKRNAA